VTGAVWVYVLHGQIANSLAGEGQAFMRQFTSMPQA
jgi:hypothetical protein